MKVCFFTLGCKVNQQETAAMINIFSQNGWEIAEDKEVSDVYIVNSCTVTLSGDKKSIQWIRRAKKQNPDAVVVLCGCMPQAFPDKAIAVAEADIIIGSSRQAGEYLLPRYVGRSVETVMMVCLDNKNKVINTTIVHEGSVNVSEVSVQAIASVALQWVETRL